MPDSIDLYSQIPNQILAALPDSEYRRLLPNLDQIELIYSEDIYKLGDTIQYVYFPNSGIISLLAAVADHSTLEVGIVGKEGMVGLPLFLGVNASNNHALVQGAGTAMRLSSDSFIAELAKGGELASLLMRFAHSLLVQVSQSAVCYRFHSIEERLARWLLMTSDRMETNDFRITQDFLSNMLGVRREAVNRSAARLKQQKMIKKSRGWISIVDRPGLEAASCQCYMIIKSEENSRPANLNVLN